VRPELRDLFCSMHAKERWDERADQAHPSHNRNHVVRYLLSHANPIPSDLGVEIYALVSPQVQSRRTSALEHLYYWDEVNLLFIVTPDHYGVEQREYPVIRTLVKLTDAQEQRLTTALKEIKEEEDMPKLCWAISLVTLALCLVMADDAYRTGANSWIGWLTGGSVFCAGMWSGSRRAKRSRR